MDDKTRELIEKANELLWEPGDSVKAETEPYRKELAKVEKQRDQAYQRMEKQKAAGRSDLAALSRKAYRYCRDYAEKLKGIISGIEAQAKAKDHTVVFTKHSKKRFLNKDYIDGLSKWDKYK